MIIEVRNAPKQRIDLFAIERVQNIRITQDVIIVPVYEDIPEYEGAYEVIPSAQLTQKLNTAKKVLTKDVTVHKIPYYEMDNEAGGMTIYIGSDEELVIE